MATPELKKRKRDCNWTDQEMHILAVAKAKEWQEYKKSSARGNMVTDKEKWNNIMDILVSNGVAGRDANQIRNKWNHLLKAYRLIKDFQLKSTGNLDFWKMNSGERDESGLPKLFSRDFYVDMDFMAERPCNSQRATSSSFKSITPAPSISSSHQIETSTPSKSNSMASGSFLGLLLHVSFILISLSLCTKYTVHHPYYSSLHDIHLPIVLEI